MPPGNPYAALLVLLAVILAVTVGLFVVIVAFVLAACGKAAQRLGGAVRSVYRRGLRRSHGR